ncbi:MAG: hypothetical protein HFI39_09105 [Lachnospiraceae bacterium]|nr:hypothetical protein [Lachnospiraceae bacterium]
MPLWASILIGIAAVLLIGVVILYFVGSKMQTRQLEQEQLMEQMAQTVSMLVIDKKILRMKESGLPPAVLEQTPKYMRRAKVPVVKGKVGNRIMVMLADNAAYEILPVKSEAKVVISGIYIREVKSVRGKTIQAPEKKKGFFSRFRKDKDQKAEVKKTGAK